MFDVIFRCPIAYGCERSELVLAPELRSLVSRLFAASATVAANIALAVAVVVLVIHGWFAGRAAKLHGVQLLIVTTIAGGLGIVMIILKNFVVTNLH